jgi:hypothetical protein
MILSMEINGNELLVEALKKLNIDLLALIAETSLWASPLVCKQLELKIGSSTRYPNVRRGRHFENRGDVIAGIRIDDNTYANNAIKNAIGLNRKKIVDFHTCHIYPNTCYDERYHTKIQNLVLIPNSIAQLSDNFEDVMKCLQYRSYELYGWFPRDGSIPEKPIKYPTNWREPILINKILSENELQNQNREVIIESEKNLYFDRENNEIEKVERKVPKWLKVGKTQINSIILITFLEMLEDKLYVSREKLMEKCGHLVNDFNGNFNQMAQFGKQNHGKVFEVYKNEVYLWKPVSKYILNLFQNTK